jgi:hypothetical protein
MGQLAEYSSWSWHPLSEAPLAKWAAAVGVAVQAVVALEVREDSLTGLAAMDQLVHWVAKNGLDWVAEETH